MIGHATGALGEGKLQRHMSLGGNVAHRTLDGIHIDMNHLKKGEVK